MSQRPLSPPLVAKNIWGPTAVHVQKAQKPPPPWPPPAHVRHRRAGWRQAAASRSPRRSCWCLAPAGVEGRRGGGGARVARQRRNRRACQRRCQRRQRRPSPLAAPGIAREGAIGGRMRASRRAPRRGRGAAHLGGRGLHRLVGRARDGRRAAAARLGRGHGRAREREGGAGSEGHVDWWGEEWGCVGCVE